MPQNFLMILGICAAIAGATYGVFLFPALTTIDSEDPKRGERERSATTFKAEYEHCRTRPEAVDCRCFAEVSETIQAHEREKVPGVQYANKEELARDQAADGC